MKWSSLFREKSSKIQLSLPNKKTKMTEKELSTNKLKVQLCNKTKTQFWPTWKKNSRVKTNLLELMVLLMIWKLLITSLLDFEISVPPTPQLKMRYSKMTSNTVF